MLEVSVRPQTREVPVLLSARDEHLFGVLTVPDGPPRGTGVVLLVGGSFIPGTNINRLSVRLARALAARGFHALRFDYHGVGESTGHIDAYRLNAPFISDLEGAVGVMRRVGLRRLVFIGTCFGARTVLAAADRIPELVAAVLMSTPVQDLAMDDAVPLKVSREKTVGELMRLAVRPQTLRGIFSRRTPEAARMRRVYARTAGLKARSVLAHLMGRGGANGAPERGEAISPHFVASFRSTVELGIPLLFLYGRDEASYEEFSQAQQQSLRPVFERARAPLDVEALDGVLHGFSTLAVQRAALERTVEWVDRIISAG